MSLRVTNVIRKKRYKKITNKDEEDLIYGYKKIMKVQ
jgi:hypothetical protein